MKYINLEHLSENAKVQKICSMYWESSPEGDFIYTVTEIAKTFDTNAHDVTKRLKLFCRAQSTEIFCTTCKEPYIFQNRADYNRQVKIAEWQCESCVLDESLAIENHKKSRLLEGLNAAKEAPFLLESLNFTDSVHLLSLIRYQASESLEYLDPYIRNQTDTLSPNKDYDIEIYKDLARKNIITINPDSDLESVILDKNGYLQYYITHVSWLVLFDTDENNNLREMTEKLEKKLSSMDWEESWYDQAKQLSSKLALEEGLAYLRYAMTEHHFDFSPGEKSTLVINKVLEMYSVAQLYNLIWRATKDAAAYYMRENIPKNQAANSVIGNIERAYEKAVTNGWEIKPFRRNYSLPSSIVSQVLYNTTLHTDDGGFTTPLHNII